MVCRSMKCSVKIIVLFMALSLVSIGVAYAQDSAKVEAAAPEATAPADFEKTGNALLDEALAKFSAAATEMDKTKSLEEAMSVMAKFGKDFEAWAEKNAVEAEKVDPALQEKFEKEMEKIQKRMEDKLASFSPAAQ